MLYLAVRPWTVVASIVSEEGGPEVGSAAEAYRRGHHVTYHLDLVSQEFHGLEEAVDARIKADGSAEIPYIVERIAGIAYFDGGVGIPLTAYLGGVHTVGDGYRGGDVDVLEYAESGADRYGVLHAVAPVFYQAFFEEFVLTCGQGVLQLSRIGHLDFFVPAFGADSLFALEGCQLAHGDSQVGETDTYRRVLGALREVECRRKRPLAIGNAVGKVDGRALGILGESRGVVGVEVVACISAGGEVDGGGQRHIGIGLGVLRVTP